MEKRRKDSGCGGPKSGPARKPRPRAAARSTATPPRVTVQAYRPEFESDFMEFVYKGDRVEILYLQPEILRGKTILTYRHSECVFFSDVPEARALHDGCAWNLDELTAWAWEVSSERKLMES